MTDVQSSLFAHRSGRRAAPLATAVDVALRSRAVEAIPTGEPEDDFDALVTLLSIYELWLAPLPSSDGREALQNHPSVAALKWRLESWFEDAMERWTEPELLVANDPVDALRRVARHDDAAVYDWLATTATWDELVTFLAIEGGPDGGFDDLVALCQVGVRGPAKVVLGTNYWDEMGRGDPAEVHTALHERLVASIDMPRIPYDELPVSALYRSALNGLLATNRRLLPEMLGALGLLELQAGPRCRKVLRALHRLHAPADAFPFYDEHAQTDPRHGKEWLEGAIRPLCDEHPAWGPRVVKGARWRAEVNRRLFADVHRMLLEGEATVNGDAAPSVAG